MIRTNSMMVRNLKLINNGSVSPQKLQTERLITETARGFIANWSTFNDDEANYRSRLSLYGKNDDYKAGQGKQTCDSVEIINVENTTDNNYRITAEVDLSQELKMPENQAQGEPRDSVIDVEKTSEGNIYTILKRVQQTVEITIRADKENITVIGYPVIVAQRQFNNIKIYEVLENDTPPNDYVVFGEQMLNLYYKGESLGNYVAEDYTVNSLGGYKMVRCEIVGYEVVDGVSKSLFKATISQESDKGSAISEMEQYIFVVAKKSDNKWQLLRLGAF